MIERPTWVATSVHALEQVTAAAAQATGCELVRAGQTSRHHHGWSTDLWATGAAWRLPWCRHRSTPTPPACARSQI
jgi:hypothetical protein